jgi:hypothetical protein
MIHDKATSFALAQVRSAFPSAAKVTCKQMDGGGLFITVGFMRGGGLLRYGAQARGGLTVQDAIRSIRGRAIGEGVKV